LSENYGKPAEPEIFPDSAKRACPRRVDLDPINDFCADRSCPWDVERAAEYQTYLSRRASDYGPRLTLLLQVDGSGHAGESYRFAAEGGPWDSDIWSRDLFDPASLGGYRLRYQLRGEDIDLKPNALASKWEDVDTLLGRGTLVAMKAGENTDRTAEFRAILGTEKEADQNFGAAVRWAVQATNHGKLRLVLQGLPGGARRLQSEPLLTADEAEAIQLEAIDAEADLKEDSPCRGPIPVLFARDMDAVQTALELHPERVYTGNTNG
jgi:hypothetical protein